MKRKRNKFFTLIFSMMFGAGQMYMGFMKIGVSLMTAATAIIFCGIWFESGVIMFALPVLWFYSFFDSINMMSMPDENFQGIEDHYLIIWNTNNRQIKNLLTKFNAVLAVVLILVGVSMIGNTILNTLINRISYGQSLQLYKTFRYLNLNVFRSLFALVIIVVGIKMIIGKKTQLDSEELPMQFYSINDQPQSNKEEIIIREKESDENA